MVEQLYTEKSSSPSKPNMQFVSLIHIIECPFRIAIYTKMPTYRGESLNIFEAEAMTNYFIAFGQFVSGTVSFAILGFFMQGIPTSQWFLLSKSMQVEISSQPPFCFTQSSDLIDQ